MKTKKLMQVSYSMIDGANWYAPCKLFSVCFVFLLSQNKLTDRLFVK